MGHSPLTDNFLCTAIYLPIQHVPPASRRDRAICSLLTETLSKLLLIGNRWDWKGSYQSWLCDNPLALSVPDILNGYRSGKPVGHIHSRKPAAAQIREGVEGTGPLSDENTTLEMGDTSERQLNSSHWRRPERQWRPWRPPLTQPVVPLPSTRTTKDHSSPCSTSSLRACKGSGQRSRLTGSTIPVSISPFRRWRSTTPVSFFFFQ